LKYKAYNIMVRVHDLKEEKEEVGDTGGRELKSRSGRVAGVVSW